ncbi:hypothetical protein E4T56_gene18219 [Termitomyces sp. T112]|nr:hypothetical protein E4T56_gene18219 [Termitomyces sp. T112]
MPSPALSLALSASSTLSSTSPALSSSGESNSHWDHRQVKAIYYSYECGCGWPIGVPILRWRFSGVIPEALWIAQAEVTPEKFTKAAGWVQGPPTLEWCQAEVPLIRLGPTTPHPSQWGISHSCLDPRWTGVDALRTSSGVGAGVQVDGAVVGGASAEEYSRLQSMVGVVTQIEVDLVGSVMQRILEEEKE